MKFSFNSVKYVAILVLLALSSIVSAKNDSAKTKTTDYISLGAGVNIPLTSYSTYNYTSDGYGAFPGCALSVNNTYLFNSGFCLIASVNGAYNTLNKGGEHADKQPDPFKQVSVLVGCSYFSRLSSTCMLGIKSMIGGMYFQNSLLTDSGFGVVSYGNNVVSESSTSVNKFNLYLLTYDVGLELKLMNKHHEITLALDYMNAYRYNGLTVVTTSDWYNSHPQYPGQANEGVQTQTNKYDITINSLSFTIGYGLCVKK